MSNLKTLLFLLVLTSPLTGNSQLIIKGVVIDSDSEVPLSKASVKISSHSEFALTNESGSFKLDIPNISALDTLVVTYVGYRKYLLPISQRNNQTDLIKTAYFRIDDSHVFKDSIQKYFQKILDSGTQYLIIDLRGGGGIREEEHVAELYSYLVSEPFRVYEPTQVKSNDYKLFDKDFTYKPYAKSLKQIKENFFDKLVDSGNGYYLWQPESYMGLIKPADLQFKGTIYILVDGRNYSASTDFTSIASELNNVFIVGEETGGEYRSYISGTMFGLVLPNSKIGVKIPTWKSIMAINENPANRGRGVLPDFPLAESLNDFVNGRDAIKEYAYELIRNKK